MQENIQKHLLTSVLCLCDSCNEIRSSVVNKGMTDNVSFVPHKMKVCVSAVER